MTNQGPNAPMTKQRARSVPLRTPEASERDDPATLPTVFIRYLGSSPNLNLSVFVGGFSMISNVRFWGTRVADWDNADLTRATRTFVRGSGRASRDAR